MPELRGREILRITGSISALPPGFRAYLLDDERAVPVPDTARDVYELGTDWRYVDDGDVIRIEPTQRALAVLYRRSSPSNSFLVTERCDNYCLMCSQPPKTRDDGWLVDELFQIIPLVSQETEAIGITGGEPALLGERLVQLVAAMQQHLPTTAIHILSNGRAFRDPMLARALAGLHHPDLMIGIPLYSDLPEEHDYVVQSVGAYEDTLRGILNLKQLGVRVELRFVIDSQTQARLPAFARFVARNLCFVDHVALMGLELTGFAKANLAMLWCDPLDYQLQLVEAIDTLHRAGLPTSIYNHALCVLPEALHVFARKSISDWKNMYVAECDGCTRKDDCGGFFASGALRMSRGIQAFAD